MPTSGPGCWRLGLALGPPAEPCRVSYAHPPVFERDTSTRRPLRAPACTWLRAPSIRLPLRACPCPSAPPSPQGVAYAEPSCCRLGATELLLDDTCSGLEAVLVQLGAREAVVNRVRGLTRVAACVLSGWWCWAGGGAGAPRGVGGVG